MHLRNEAYVVHHHSIHDVPGQEAQQLLYKGLGLRLRFVEPKPQTPVVSELGAQQLLEKRLPAYDHLLKLSHASIQLFPSVMARLFCAGSTETAVEAPSRASV